MSKLTYFFVIVAIAMCINADDDVNDENEKPNDGFNPGFPQFQMFPYGFPGMPPMENFPPMKPFNPDDIAKLKPSDKNTKIQGAMVSTYEALDTVNGVPINKVNTARVVTNDNGNVTDTTYSN